MPKAQAATERLMTMGYGLLTVMIVVGALAYFDILTPSRFIPEKCVLGGGLKCADYQLQFQRVTLRLENTLGKDMQITKVELISRDLDGGNCSLSKNFVLKPMAATDIEISDCAFTKEGKSKARVNVVYHYGSAIDHVQEGELVIQVDNPYDPSSNHTDSCSDNDGGLIYYFEGTVTGWYNNEYYSIIDMCNGTDDSINERYCDGAYANTTKFICPNQCKIGFGKCKDPDACEDSDGGLNYGTFGTVSGNLSGEPYSYDDFCFSGTILSEYFCSNSKSNLTNSTCLSGCLGGLCNSEPGDSCKDTDGGKDYSLNGSTYGNFSGSPYSHSDTCINTTTLTEYFCSGANSQSENYTCSYSCSDGKCSAAPGDSCLDSDGGLVYNESGTVSGNYNGSPYIYPDSCYNTTLLVEYYCYNTTTLWYVTFPCTYNCSTGRCNAPPTDSCAETDGGNDIYNFGTTSGYLGGVYYRSNDFCKDANTLNESWCSGANRLFAIESCPSGCEIALGKCKAGAPDSCTDSDGGNNYNVKGNVTGNATGSPYFHPDECIDGTHLTEYNCTGTHWESSSYTCPYQCSGGKCVTCGGTPACSGLLQPQCQACPVCLFTAAGCSGTASACSSYGNQANCQACGCTWSSSSVNYAMQTCFGYWGFNCGTAQPDSDNTLDTCSNALGTHTNNHVDDIQVNGTAFPVNDMVGISCTFDPDAKQTKEYIYVKNPGGTWQQLYTGSPQNTNVHTVTVIYSGTSSVGPYWARCIADYVADSDNCGDSGSYYDNDDLPFTVVSGGGCSGTTTYSCAPATCDSTCGCTSIPSSCSNSGTCASCPVGSCTSCPGCTLS